MNFRFQNLLGAPYRGGNAVISNNTLLLSPVGNRVSVTDLRKSETTTLPIQASSKISRVAVSPDGIFLLAIDDNNRCLFINPSDHHRTFLTKPRHRNVLYRLTFLTRICFSPRNSEMVKELLSRDNGIICSSWNYSGIRLVTGSTDGSLSVFDFRDLASSSNNLRFSLKTKVHEGTLRR